MNKQKKWAKYTYPPPPKAMTPGSWKAVETERKKNKKIKQKAQTKPFEVKHYRFYPCLYSKDVKAGYLYYLIVRNKKGYLLPELTSPKFKTKEEAVKYAIDNNIPKGYLPG